MFEYLENYYWGNGLVISPGPFQFLKNCLCTMSADREFDIDTCPRAGRKAVIACNGAGHAEK